MKYALFCLLGVVLGAGGAALAIIPDANRVHLADQQTIQRLQEQNGADAKTQAERFKAAYINAMERVASLSQQLKETRDVASRTQPPAQDPPIEGAATVIFDKTPRQVDMSLSLSFHGVNLGKLPKFRVGPEGPLYPHWVLRGIVAPMVAGEDHGAVYYYFQNGQWLGPYPPENVLQQ